MSRYSWAGAAQRDVDETCSEFEARVAREATRRGFERTARQVVLGDEHFPDTVRIQVANAARRYPQLLVALSHNRISLTVAGLVASNVDESNADELVSACEGKSKRDAEEYLVSIRPKPVYEPSIRKQATRAPSLPSAPPSDPTHASPPASSRNSGWERRAHRTVARCGPFISHFLRAPAFVFAGGSIRERRELGNELAADAVELGFELAHEGVAPT
jgi:hypothetical protein